jgi:pyruvate/2-oxoglutarate dehydrogenase complex dihydrolipoamide acyltransferase (E2) component
MMYDMAAEHRDPVPLELPALGMAMADATVVRWHRQPGDPVTAGDPVVEIETEKSNVDLESPATGTLGPHLFQPNAVVPVGAVLVVIEPQGWPARSPEPAEGAGRSGPVNLERASSTAGSPAEEVRAEGERAPHALSPRQRWALEQEAAAPAEPPRPAEGARMRERIARVVTEAWETIPHFTVTKEIDAHELVTGLDGVRARAQANLTDVLLRSLVLALPPGEGTSDLGLAVATPGGVVITVVERILDLPLAELASARKAAVERARSNRLHAGDLSKTPLATLSNLGALAGVDQFTGVVPLGQTLLLTVGRVALRPFVIDEAVVARSSLFATLNVDHRAYDGDGAGLILDSFAEAISSPSRVLAEGVLH